jgi:Putative MetA-pathway of phenol degradation
VRRRRSAPRLREGRQSAFVALVLTCAAALLLPTRAHAQYRWLFDPVPRAEMRELSTDRPDTTESPMSVDAGHLQVETDLFSGYLRYDGRWAGESLMGINAKVGLTPFADLQVVFSTFEDHIDQDGAHTSGMGDTILRLKLNLVGNDGGDVAIGLLPMVTLPTGDGGVSAEQAEFGLAIPMGFALPENFDLGAMVEIDAVHDGGGAYHAEFLATLTAGHELFGPLSAFVEVTNTVVFEQVVDAQGTVNGGLVLGFDDAVQLDLGVNVRTWGNADEDLRMFLGATVRQ